MASPDDLEFSVLPSEEPVITPEENLRLAVEEATSAVLQVNPTVSGTDPTTIGRGWAFDFAKGQFVRHGAAPAEVREVDSLKVWIEKTLYTARYAHPIYSGLYGTEGLFDLISGPDNPGLYRMLQGTIRDALLVHDRISDVVDFRFGRADEYVEVYFRVVLDNGSQIDVPLTLNGV